MAKDTDDLESDSRAGGVFSFQARNDLRRNQVTQDALDRQISRLEAEAAELSQALGLPVASLMKVLDLGATFTLIRHSGSFDFFVPALPFVAAFG